MQPAVDEYNQRFGNLFRLYGCSAEEFFKEMHICVIGLGGVGSWAVEALARTGVGQITLIDFDVVRPSNTNRQLQALTKNTNKKKFEVLVERIAGINPECQCHPIDDFLTFRTLEDFLSKERQYDYVIDAIDNVKFKAAMINHCKRNKIPLVTTGGAGGASDPTQISVDDLSRTYHDPLASKVRAELRSKYGFSRDQKRKFGIECVFCTQQRVYPREDGSVSHQKPGIKGISLDCQFGYGSVSFVTATFGFIAASRAVNKSLNKKLAVLCIK